MAIISNTSEFKSYQTQEALTVKQVQEKLTSKAVSTVCEIVSDNTMRMEGCKEKIQLLSSGIFYGNEYMKALKATNQQARLDFFKKKGSFYHGYASPKHFNMPKDSNTPTGISGDFVLKEGIKPSEALEAMRKGLSLIGCGETCQISYYEAIKDVLGTEKFDILFSANSPTPLKIKFDTPDNPINCLINRTLKPKKIVKGQIIYILNIPDYKIKHLNGEARGFTAICVDDTPEKETFTTLGLPAKGATYAGVNQVLITEFNNPPIGMEVVTEEVATRILQSYTSQELLMVKEYENSQVSTEEFKELEGGKILAVFEFNTKRITQLRNSSLQEARSLFNKWQQ